MSNEKEATHWLAGSRPHSASHPPWTLRIESAVYVSGAPRRPNMADLASQMCDWTQQKDRELQFFVEDDKGAPGSFTNPYTYQASSIGVVLAAAINDAARFSRDDDPMSPLDAEIARVRLENELVLNSARFCEATIKQMLYCTSFRNELYERASLGQLLASSCQECRKAGKPHDFSLLGALACRYFLCHILDQCAFEHLSMVNRRRNLEAAHSGAQLLNPRDPGQSRADLADSLKKVGRELGHMADHIGAIERKLMQEIQLYILYSPGAPPSEVLSNIPVRQRREPIDPECGAAAEP